jgi:hypothetical protein
MTAQMGLVTKLSIQYTSTVLNGVLASVRGLGFERGSLIVLLEVEVAFHRGLAAQRVSVTDGATNIKTYMLQYV